MLGLDIAVTEFLCHRSMAYTIAYTITWRHIQGERKLVGEELKYLYSVTQDWRLTFKHILTA